jgi:glycosyltransferase involved in cell wall biosynthesis
MPVRYFGIFLAYGPTVDLRKEGLGRLLGAFLKAAATREDVRFVIACPQWLKRNLLAFCESEGIPAKAFDVVSTEGLPFVLRLYLAYLDRKSKPSGRSRLNRALKRLQGFGVQHRKYVEGRIVAARSAIPLFAVVIYATSLGVLLLPLVAFAWVSRTVLRALLRAARIVRLFLGSAAVRGLALVHDHGEESLELRLYRTMEDMETQRIRKSIDGLRHVSAWFSPTAFWPAFNNIAAPRLLCVPDVVPTEFPIGFSRESDLLKSFDSVERTIRNGHHFVTYSARVKWNTLVDRYSVNPEDVTVVPHACWDLSGWIKVSGFLDEDCATRTYCESLLQRALGRAGTDGYVQGLRSGSLRFLFYPSQFRPNKNVVVLLQAYEHLLRERFIHHKLILTGDPNRYPPVSDFVREHGLSNEVLFLHGLTTPELAACYYLADLAVNPSLSEGACPFTLTEALSVDTPVVMARISVTEDVVRNPALREMMLFDPYDYLDVSTRIEWALRNHESLLSAQREAYAQLRQRTWRDVVDEYVRILDRLADNAVPGPKK